MKASKCEDIRCLIELLEDDIHEFGIRVTFENIGDEVVSMSARDLLQEHELTWDAFEVYGNDLRVKYRGKTVKRRTEDGAQLSIQAGQKVFVDIALSQYYDIAGPRSYRVQYKLIYADRTTQTVSVIESNTLTVEVH